MRCNGCSCRDEDDRNDEVEGSPVPDPTEEPPDGDDIPEAD